VLVPEFVFNKISEVRNAQGILGIIQKIPTPLSFPPDAGNYLLLDNLRDPGNLGTLIRSAVGAGFAGVLLYGNCADPFSPKTVRSTMGTFAFTQIASIKKDEINQMLADGYHLCATTGAGGENIYTTHFGAKNILMIGSEAHGLSDELMELATQKITIPLQPECESLNAAVAGSICLFQIQHNAPSLHSKN
jgi:TrmH family RNA methyltransferase